MNPFSGQKRREDRQRRLEYIKANIKELEGLSRSEMAKRMIRDGLYSKWTRPVDIMVSVRSYIQMIKDGKPFKTFECRGFKMT